MATATVTETPVIAAEPAELPEGVPYLLSAKDYFRMVDADIIPSERRIGLWKGRLYEKMAKKLRHSGAQNLLLRAWIPALPVGWCFWGESPILVDDFTAPLPDMSLVQGTPNLYTRRGSVPKLIEIGLVIEVADTSLRKNLTESLQTYARAGLPCYWVINLVARRVEVYTSPETVGTVARYATSEVFEPGKAVPLVLDGREVARIPVSDLLPEETP